MSSPRLLAELELFHTRPTVATRRIALGHLVLPSDPPPGGGALLLGAVVARFVGGVDPELRFDLTCLVDEVEAGLRVVQPRLRHRYQVDRQGLAVSRHRLLGNKDAVELDFEPHGTDLVQVLGAVYALERLDSGGRSAAARVIRRGLRWEGAVGQRLIPYLLGAPAGAHLLADPRGWALALLGFAAEAKPSATEVTKAYRIRMRAAHPDLGGEKAGAARAIEDLNEARRILST